MEWLGNIGQKKNIYIYIRDKEASFIMRKRSIYQEDIPIIKRYKVAKRSSKYMKQKLMEMKAKIDNSTITATDLNTSLSTTGRKTRQSINKEIEVLTGQPTKAEYKLLLNIYRLLFRIEHIPGYKAKDIL